MELTREWPSFPPWEGVEYGCPTLSPKEGIIVVTYDVVPPGEREGSDTNVQQSPKCTGIRYLMFPPVEGEFG